MNDICSSRTFFSFVIEVMNSNERHLGVQSATSTDGAPHASGGEVVESSRITADSRCSDRAVSHKTVIRKDSSATERKGESTGLEWEGAAAKSEESLVGQPTPGLSPAKGSRPDREVLSSLTMRNTKSLATTTFVSGAATAGQVLPNHGERKLGNQTTEKSIKSLETTKPQITSSSREPLESNISQQTKPFQTIQVTPTAFTGTVSTVSDERNRGNSRKSDNIAHQVPRSSLAMQLAVVPVPVAVANSNVGRSSCVGISTNDTAKEQSKEAIVLQSNPKPQQLPVSPFQPMTQFSPKSKAMSLRRGKWTAEEEAYVARVIQDFNSGFLNAPAGTTLRTYLSDKLHCDPMRITKKFTGEACIGKRVFHPAVRCPSSAPSIDRAQVRSLNLLGS